MSNSIAAARGLTKRFSPESGVFDLSFEIPESQIIGFIGPSGSGKTTTVRLINGLLKPDEGEVRVFGRRPSDFDKATRARIGYMPQQALLYPDLTLAQNLSFAASLYGLGRGSRDRQADLVEFLGLGHAIDRLPAQASGGEQRRLMLAATLVHSPDLLFLDEPTAGIDPVLRRRIWDRLQEISANGTSMVVTTQYVGEAAYCDYVAVLANGRVIAYETPEGLRRKAYGGELIDVVLGEYPRQETIAGLEQAVGGRHYATIDDRTIRLVTPDAGEAGPKIGRWADDAGIELLESEAHVPPFDDVFVELVESLDNEAAEGREDENGKHLAS